MAIQVEALESSAKRGGQDGAQQTFEHRLLTKPRAWRQCTRLRGILKGCSIVQQTAFQFLPATPPVVQAGQIVSAREFRPPSTDNLSRSIKDVNARLDDISHTTLLH
jgi:hypothetical protein